MKKIILYTVMDWGIGHATRSIPVINELSEAFEVVIASSGSALLFLKTYFPGKLIIEKPGYGVSYSSNLPAAISVIGQSRKILRSITAEKKWIDQFVQETTISRIYSDNCYGCYSKNIPSTIITHQLLLESPFPFPFSKKLTGLLVRKLLKPFNEILIPDIEPPVNYSGRLSSDGTKDKKVRYIGVKSRFEKSNLKETTENDICVILSGPEPQRTIFEKKCIANLTSVGKKNRYGSGSAGKRFAIDCLSGF